MGSKQGFRQRGCEKILKTAEVLIRVHESTRPIHMIMPETNVVAIYTSGLLAVVTLTYLFLRRTPPDSPQPQTEDISPKPRTGNIMQPPNENLAGPLDVPYTQEQLRGFDGSDPSKPIYVAIKGTIAFSCGLSPAHDPKGTIFDVSKKGDVYGKGKSYNLFAGKDASKALGMSSLKPEDAVPDYSTLPENERNVLDDWYSFFKCVCRLAVVLVLMSYFPSRKRYNIVGIVVDLPPLSASL
jgi:predicted heme/steroid binding protein